jgi:hypothetical protein
VANKEWALLAAGPALLALAPRRRPALIGCSLAVAALVLAPLLLVGSGGFSSALRASASSPGVLFHPWQVFWFLGQHAPASPGAGAALAHGYRVGPSWTGTISHPLVLATGLALPLALWLCEHRPRRIAPPQALLLLALLMLLRCLLDTWDIAYYPLPFVLALLAWELRGAKTHPPVLSAAATVLAYLSFIWLPNHASADVQAAVFLAWSLPLAFALAARLFASSLAEPHEVAAHDRRGAGTAQETTVSALSRPLSTSWAPSRTTSRSSIRTPSSPGM